MRYLTFLLVLAFIINSCKKDDDNETDNFQLVSGVKFVDFGPCFLEYRIDSSTIIITDAEVYNQFEKDIRNNWDLTGTCNSTHLPQVDFSNSFILGLYTENYACEASYKREVFYNDQSKTFKYSVSVSTSGECSNPFLTSFNWAIVPKKGDDIKIIYEVN